MWVKYFLAMSQLLIMLVFVAACGTPADEPSAAGKALDELQKKYDALTDSELDDPMQWASEDLKKLGDWEYKVVEVGNINSAELEETLNEAGTERWEVIWMEKTLDGHVIVMKRSSISYLSKIPLSQIGRLVIPDSEPSQ